MTGPRYAALGLAIAVASTPTTAAAYSTLVRYEQSAVLGGAGGRFYSGSPADGYTCDVCHRGADGPELTFSGIPEAFAAGETYEFGVTIDAGQGRTIGAVAEVTDAIGAPMGLVGLPAPAALAENELCLDLMTPATTTATLLGGRRLAVMESCGAAAMRFRWTAPSEATGTGTVYFAVVSGDLSADGTGDGITLEERTLEGVAHPSPAGCGIGHRPAPIALVLLLVAGAVGRRRRRGTRRGLAVGLAVAVAVAGCAVVKPAERARIDKPDMEPHRDGAVTYGEGRVDAVREGAAGGFGPGGQWPRPK